MKTSYLNDWNADLLDEYHQRWKKDPASVDATWSAFFEGFELGNSSTRNGHKTVTGPDGLPVDADLQNRVDALVTNYRILGHTQAQLDPLTDADPIQPALTLEALGLADVPGSTVVASRYFQNGPREN
jgi:2-oxoglutarate dehydrogenase E1 component